MAEGTRDRMIDGAVRLLAEKGLQQTSFGEVVAATGAPRGSIYHHFPEGKDQLVGFAVDRAGERALAALDATAGRPALEVATTFLGLWARLLEVTAFSVGCSVVAVTVATDSVDLLDRTAAVFRSWRVRLAELLAQGGIPKREAVGLAALLVAASEGAVVVARAERSLEPFDLVRRRLLTEVRRAAQ